jgi:protein involved in polysaccharide export with SLBB domain
VLREGDVIYVPEMINTVKINGAVLYPNTVLYKSGEKLNYYINQAGGYTDNAKKSRVYVVYLNGTVSRIKRGDRNKIEPGCEIVIPTKPDRRGMSTGEILSIGTSAASLATMVATLVNLFK